MNKKLHRAKQLKDDEFYTQLSDISAEVENYKKYLKDKTVYCNCDVPYVSNFHLFFMENYEKLEIKRLIVSCQEGYVYDSQYGPKIVQNGDFGGSECIELLKQSDIVISNPPFSLWRDYLKLLLRYKKQFLIVGHLNAIGYKDVFPLLQQKQLYIGYNALNRFIRPDNTIAKVSCLWFTNMPVERKFGPLVASKTYRPELYPKYDNYDAINVNRLVDIPNDYYGPMGVPITFMVKHDPAEWEVLDIIRPKLHFKSIYTRIVVRRLTAAQKAA